MAEVPKIYKAIAAIQAGVGNIPKNGVGPASQGSYKYVKNDDILEAISKRVNEWIASCPFFSHVISKSKQ